MSDEPGIYPQSPAFVIAVGHLVGRSILSLDRCCPSVGFEYHTLHSLWHESGSSRGVSIYLRAHAAIMAPT